jgi:type IV pilus assembly protein PilM
VLSVRRRVLCLDWDRRFLRMVVANVGRGAIALEDAHSYAVPAEVDVDDPQSMGPYIAGLLRQHKIRLKRVVIDMSREKAVINRVALPPTPNDELAAAVQFQALRELPFPAEQAVVDFSPTQRNAEGLVTEVLLAAVRKESLERAAATCREAGLVPARIGLRPYGNVIAIRYQQHLAEQNVLLVDVGPAMTEIDVVKHGSLAFSRAANVVVPRRGERTEPEAHADSYEVEGVDIPEYEEAQRSAVRDLEVEINRTLQAFKAMDASTAIERIVIAGDTGVEEALHDAVRARFNLPVELYDPTEALGIDPRDGQQLRAFSSAIGLAWGLSREGLLEIDFLNPKKPVVKSVEARKKAKRVGALAAVIVLLLIGWAAWDLYQLEQENQALDRRLAKLEMTALDREYLRLYVAGAEGWYQSAPVWLDHLLLITQGLIDPGMGAADAPRLNPGERVLVRELDFKADRQQVTMELEAVAFDDLRRLQQALESIERGGEPIYRVGPWEWSPAASTDGFKGSATFTIQLLDLKRLAAELAAQADAWEDVHRDRERALKNRR